MKKLIMKIVVVISYIVLSSQVNATTNISVYTGSSITIGNTLPGANYYIWNTNPVEETSSIVVNPTKNAQYIVSIFDADHKLMGTDTFNITLKNQIRSNKIAHAGIDGRTIGLVIAIVLLCVAAALVYLWVFGARV